jgi:hypothetical protein
MAGSNPVNYFRDGIRKVVSKRQIMLDSFE